MNGPPLILISPSIEKAGVEFEDQSISLSEAYPRAVAAAGGIPLTTPVGTSRERPVLDEMYAGMAAADFSRDVLEKAPELGVVPLPPCGWSDWGTPARVFESLQGTTDFAVLVRRLGAGARSFPELRSFCEPAGLRVA